MAHFILDLFCLLIKWREMVLEQCHDKQYKVFEQRESLALWYAVY